MSTETYSPAVAVEPVKRPARQGAGRRAEVNPFEACVRSVIGKTTEDGRPLTLAVSFDLAADKAETIEQRSARIRRFLTKAAKHFAEADGVNSYSIRQIVEPNGNRTEDLPGEYVVKLWDAHAKPASTDNAGE